MKKFIVGFANAYDNPKFRYHAYTEDRHWNGWECPYFTQEERDRFLSQFHESNETKPGEDPDTDELYEEFKSIEPRFYPEVGLNLYSFGSGYCWEPFKTMDMKLKSDNSNAEEI